MSQVPLRSAFAPFPLPDSLTVMFTPGLWRIRYSANALAMGPTVVEPSRTSLSPACATALKAANPTAMTVVLMSVSFFRSA